MNIRLILSDFASYYGTPDAPYPDAATTQVVGLCTGLLLVFD